MGTIAGDGMHATFPADGSSRYALGSDENLLGDRTVDPIIRKTQEWGQLENEIFDVASARAAIDELLAFLDAVAGSVSPAAQEWVQGLS